jgi:signal transduction histidine kinase
VLGNAAALTQCFSQLLGNAIKFVKPGEIPEIRIWGEVRAAEGDGMRFSGRYPSRLRIWIEDKGIGISPSMIPRVFNVFSRGTAEHDGTGIGLALVRKVVDRMGGAVGVESELGRGSRFWVELMPADPLQPLPLVLPTPPAAVSTIL